MSYDALLFLLHASQRQREKINEQLAREEEERTRKAQACDPQPKPQA